MLDNTIRQFFRELHEFAADQLPVLLRTVFHTLEMSAMRHFCLLFNFCTLTIQAHPAANCQIFYN
jgi:hypothetical protein